MRNKLATEHLCDKLRYLNENEDLFTKIRVFNGNWVYHSFHYACEKCVYDGEAQYEKELLSVYDVAINYCPYCGLLLNKDRPTKKAPIEISAENQEHCCSNIEEYNRTNPRVGFSFDTDAVWKITRDTEYWYLSRHSIATERMVLNGEADKDELIHWQGTSIFYCPLCGVKLPE